MANAVTPNMGIELPTPGVTGALGVEPPGQSWLELLNAGLAIVDAHDHGAAGGVPLTSAAIGIDADLPFGGFAATGLRGVYFTPESAAMVGAAEHHVAYFVNDDLYINNGSGVAVRITNGSNVAGAAGNITGLSGTAAVAYSSGLGVFSFESSTGVKAGLYAGPISIYEPIAGGKKVTVSVPAGLAADYALTLAAALPAALAFVQVSAAGALVFDTDVTDNASLQQSAGVLSVKDGGITKTKLADPGVVFGTDVSYTSNATAMTDVTGGTVSLADTIGRPVMVMLAPIDPLGALQTQSVQVNAGATGTYGGVQLLRRLNGGAWTRIASFQASYVDATHVGYFSIPPVIDNPGAGDVDYKLQAYVGDAASSLSILGCRLAAYEL